VTDAVAVAVGNRPEAGPATATATFSKKDLKWTKKQFFAVK